MEIFAASTLFDEGNPEFYVYYLTKPVHEQSSMQLLKINVQRDNE